jgi:nitroreductase
VAWSLAVIVASAALARVLFARRTLIQPQERADSLSEVRHADGVDLDSGAGLLHRLTRVDAARGWEVFATDDERLRRDLSYDADETLAPQVKAYPAGLPTLMLPRELPTTGMSATAALAGVSVASQSLDAAQLGRLLFLGAGVVRTSQRRGRTWFFRAAGSAGGRFPLEVYASTKGVDGVPDGVHWYDPVEHALRQVGPPATGEATTLVATGVPWRTGQKYAERGWRHLYWDAGTLTSQLVTAANSAGLDPRLRTLFPDREVGELVGVDGVHEFPLLLLSFGDRPPAVEPSGPSTRGVLPEIEFPLVTAAQHSGDRDFLGDPWPPGAPLPSVPDSEPLEQVVLRRGSQRRMIRSATMPREKLDWPMRAALRGIDVPHWVAVHGVDGVAPGVYRWPDLDTPVRTGDLRDLLIHVAMDQPLAGEAAYVAISAIHSGNLDDRGYREAQLAAGMVEGRLHLAAYALGVTATGMTFYDSEVPGLLGQSDDLIGLLFTCVGVAEYRSTPGGGPGSPASVRVITPRLPDDE